MVKESVGHNLMMYQCNTIGKLFNGELFLPREQLQFCSSQHLRLGKCFTNVVLTPKSTTGTTVGHGSNDVILKS